MTQKVCLGEKSLTRDIRLLTLYKQHYLDKYSNGLDSNYSCWGYYDGMDIAKINKNEYSELSEKHSLSPVSELWYCAGEKIGQINGQYSSQNIGLFRCMQDDEQNVVDFWQENDVTIFFGVAFLKLIKPMEYYDFAQRMEEKINQNVDQKYSCRIITYCTFDNADLILLIHGNSLWYMEQNLRQIEMAPEVRYQHSVLGVSEQYLSACLQQKKILECWKESECAVNENVARLEIRIVSSGETQLMAIEKRILEETNNKYGIKNFNAAKYAYVSGHENLVILFEDTDVKSMLALLLPKGFATHQNESYEKRRNSDTGQHEPQLYNIESSYMLKCEDLSSVEGESYSQQAETMGVSNNWIQEQIENYKKHLGEAHKKKDEGLYAYFWAALQTLNTLMQYERFALSEDIYYLLYLSFKMFDEKLTEALNKAYDNSEDKDYAFRMSQIKKSLCEYISSVNSVIYHTIHTDQVFLMIPGYSGTSFSIPIKLNMLFLWFTDCVAYLLGNNERKYQCILVPTMESTPETCRLQFGCEETKFLVCVKISQRTLYMPRELMIILAHEMGHYIGGDLRCRDVRSQKLKKFVAQYFIDCVLPNIDESVGNEIEKLIIPKLRNVCLQEAETIIEEYFEQLKGGGYYGKDVEKLLKGAGQRLLAESKVIITQNIGELYTDWAEVTETDFVVIYRIIEKSQEHAMNKLIHSTMMEAIEKELKVYQEVFSDIVAIKLLKCSSKAYDEAYRISEGAEILSDESKRRRNAMNSLGQKIDWESKEPQDDRPYADELLCEYLEECNQWLDNRISDLAESPKKKLEDIRQLYLLFERQENSKAGYHEIYTTILRCILEMKENINKEICIDID